MPAARQPKKKNSQGLLGERHGSSLLEDLTEGLLSAPRGVNVATGLLTQGPQHHSLRRQMHPGVGYVGGAEVGPGDFTPGLGAVLAEDDFAHLQALDAAGMLDEGPLGTAQIGAAKLGEWASRLDMIPLLGLASKGAAQGVKLGTKGAAKGVQGVKNILDPADVVTGARGLMGQAGGDLGPGSRGLLSDEALLSQANELMPETSLAAAPKAPRRKPTLGERLLATTPDLHKVKPHLDPVEWGKLKSDTAQRVVQIWRAIPSAKEMASVAFAGRAKRGWYKKSARTIQEVFGDDDAPRFAALLAGTSPQTSVQDNLTNTLQIWNNWVRAGRPTDERSIRRIMGASVQGTKGEGSVLPAWINNSVRALSAEDPRSVVISGPKVNSFMLNLRGYVDRVTLDAHMANYKGVKGDIFGNSATDIQLGKGDPGYNSAYLAGTAKVRQAAKILSRRTGEEWTPSEVQETIWSFAKTLKEAGEAAGETRAFKELLRSGDITHDMIGDTPDFATLFQEGAYNRILREGGYGEQTDRLASVMGGDDRVGLLGSGSVTNPEGAGVGGIDFRRDLERAANRLQRGSSTRGTGERLAFSIDTEAASKLTAKQRDELAYLEKLKEAGLVSPDFYDRAYAKLMKPTSPSMLERFERKTLGGAAVKRIEGRLQEDIKKYGSEGLGPQMREWFPHDPEGRKLVGRFIVGDEGLSEAQIVRVADILADRVKSQTAADLALDTKQDRAILGYAQSTGPRGGELSMGVASDTSASTRNATRRHELGHVVDYRNELVEKASNLPAAEADALLAEAHELSKINRPSLWEMTDDWTMRYVRSPREAFADALAQYMRNGKRAKELAPKFAKFVRDNWNESDLAKVLGYASAAALMTDQMQGASDEATKQVLEPQTQKEPAPAAFRPPGGLL